MALSAVVSLLQYPCFSLINGPLDLDPFAPVPPCSALNLQMTEPMECILKRFKDLSHAQDRTGGLSLWLVLWLLACHIAPGKACPRLCVCYHMPTTVSCQSQNFSSVPAGVPYDSQRVFLQNNRITELRADSFGFETQ
ncbi:reticulon-4 receptor-like 2, partial [Clarias magur]